MARFKRKRGPVRAKKVTVDNIDFKSGLEAYMYKALKNANIKATYEGTTTGSLNVISLLKGRPNESFPLRWKLFKKLMAQDYPKTTLYKPQNQKECDETIKLILGNQKN